MKLNFCQSVAWERTMRNLRTPDELFNGKKFTLDQLARRLRDLIVYDRSLSLQEARELIQRLKEFGELLSAFPDLNLSQPGDKEGV